MFCASAYIMVLDSVVWLVTLFEDIVFIEKKKKEFHTSHTCNPLFNVKFAQSAEISVACTVVISGEMCNLLNF